MEISNLTVILDGRRVLDHLSVSFPDSGVVCLLAPSGSGKTTLLRVLCGLQKADGGTISGLVGRKVSVVFQEDRLLEQLTALQNITLVQEQADRALASEFLCELDLADWGDAFPRQLSGGMKRRVSLARAFLYGGGDAVYLLDEPMKGLDELAVQKVVDFINRHKGSSLVLYVTHDVREAEKIADWIFAFSESMQVVSSRALE